MSAYQMPFHYKNRGSVFEINAGKYEIHLISYAVITLCVNFPSLKK